MRLIYTLAAIVLLAWTTAATAQGIDSSGSAQTSDHEPAAAAVAQEAATTLDHEQALQRIRDLETALTKAATRIRNQEGAAHTPPDVTASYYTALKWDYEYAIRMRKHTDWLFWWQLISVYALLGVTILIVLFGVYVSVRELGKAMRASTVAAQQPASTVAGKQPTSIDDNPEVAADELAEATPGQHTLKLSATEARITTTLTGVVILVLALGYLYLFVDKVMDFTLQPAVATSPPDPQ